MSDTTAEQEGEADPILVALHEAVHHLSEAHDQIYRQREKAASRIEHAGRCLREAIHALLAARRENDELRGSLKAVLEAQHGGVAPI